GFDAVQLGPQGQTSRSNPSPYDGSVFSRNVASLSLGRLADDPRYRGLLEPGTLERAVLETPETGPGDRYRHAFDTVHAAVNDASARFFEGVHRGKHR